MLVISDIDGVIANIEHRLHHLKNKDYAQFYGCEMANDAIIHTGIETLERLTTNVQKLSKMSVDIDLAFCSGRPERSRALTRMWIETQTPFDQPLTVFRKDNDYRPSPEVKIELVKQILQNYNLLEPSEVDTIFFIDDDPLNVKAICEYYPFITGLTFGIGRME